MSGGLDILALLQSQLIGIPLTNPLSYVYAIFNILLIVYAVFFGSSSSTTG